MTANQTFGVFGAPGEQCEYLTLSFSPFNVPLRSRWRNNGVSADFLGDYVLTFLPGTGNVAAEIRHAVAYVANELLENAMKYRDTDTDIPIGIHLELSSEQITVRATNGARQDQAQRYQEFIEYIQAGDAGELLINQLEQSAMGIETNKSCLGLLTMVNDYCAKLGWRFEEHPEYAEKLTVTTSVILPIRNLPGVENENL